jgi:GR25 family glycosyltransferase involved in LPS biosynthesis
MVVIVRWQLALVFLSAVGAARRGTGATAAAAAAACAAADETGREGAADEEGAAASAGQDAGTSACVALSLPQGGEAEIVVALREPLPHRLPPAVSALVTEHQGIALAELLGRVALLSRFRRLELQRAWESRTLSGSCLRLRATCDTRASVETLWPGLECLVIGRSLFDARVAEDVALWTRVRAPDVVVLDEWPSEPRAAALVAANFVAALRPRHTLVVPEPLPRGLCGAARVSVAGLGSSLVVAHWQREGRRDVEHGQHLLLACRKSALTRQVVVSLKRHRHARLDSFLRRADVAGLHPEPFDAVDGRALRLTPVLRDLFKVVRKPTGNPYEDHGLRHGVLGCALSHLAVWAELVSDPRLAEDDAVLVMEDDATFPSDFGQRWRAEILQGALLDARWDILFLGFSDDFPALASRPVGPGLRAFTHHSRSFGGGTFGYLIRRRGAGALLALARREGLSQPVDWFMIDAMTSAAHVVAFKSSPHLVGTIDVDSQTNSFYPFTLDHVCRAKAEAEPGVEQARSMLHAITVVAPTGLVSRDADVTFELRLAPGVRIEMLRERSECLMLCHRVDLAGEEREAPPPDAPASRCHRLLESDPQVMLDWRTVNDSSREYALRAALWSGAALVMEAPAVSFSVRHDWLRLDATGERVRVVTAEHSLDTFLAKHAADQLCVDGRCTLLGSLPRSLPGCGKGQRTAAASVTTLAGATLLWAPLLCPPQRAPWQVDVTTAGTMKEL